jgi:dihydroxyacetone kinase
MAGASLTLLKVNDEIKGLLTEPAEVSIRVF